MPDKPVRIWVKKQLRLDQLTFKQRDMVEIGSAGVLDVFRRVRAGVGPNDGAAKPLSKRYAIWKTRKGLGNRRNLFATGQMLGALKLRTVTDNRAIASVGANARTMYGNKWRTVKVRKRDKRTGRLVETGEFRNLTNKDVAWANQEREPWLVFSPKNRAAVMAKARQVLTRITKGIVRTGGSPG